MTQDDVLLFVFGNEAVRAGMLIEPVELALGCDGMVDRVMALGGDWRDRPLQAPDRHHLIGLVND